MEAESVSVDAEKTPEDTPATEDEDEDEDEEEEEEEEEIVKPKKKGEHTEDLREHVNIIFIGHVG